MYKSKLRTPLLGALGGLVLAAGIADRATAQSAPASANVTKVADGFTLLVAGDLLGPEGPITGLDDPEFARVLALIQGADAAFANLETSAFDLATFQGSKSAQNGGGYPLLEPAVLKDLKAMGLDMVSVANNHAGDWGAEGLTSTLETLREAGMVQAGGGGSLTQARAPGIFAARSGRVALIATASTFNPATPAADGSEDVRPRPGISVLRTEAAIRVNQAQMETLRSIAGPTYEDPAAGRIMVGEQAFELGAKTGATYTIDAGDETAILASIKAARRSAEVAMLSIHAHETPEDGGGEAAPADFLTPFFHKAIEVGADLVVRHGPHVLGGVEIYKGRPIFYGMGSLFWALGGPERKFRGIDVPQGYYDTAVAIAKFQDGTIAEIRIFPLTIRTDHPATFSAPVRAAPADAKRILEKMRKDSEIFGTNMRIEDGVGIVVVPPRDRALPR